MISTLYRDFCSTFCINILQSITYKELVGRLRHPEDMGIDYPYNYIGSALDSVYFIQTGTSKRECILYIA